MEFTGKERDKNSTFDYTYFGARYYDADLGVFTTVDPMAGLYPNTSPFAYCKNDPINYIDPDGRLVDVIADIAFIAYDVGDILYSAYKGEEVSATQYAALTADVACAFVPIATGGGIAVRAAAKSDDAAKAAIKYLEKVNILKRNVSAGKKAEKATTQGLKREVGDAAEVLENVTAKYADGTTTRLDNVVVDTKTGDIVTINETKSGGGGLSKQQARTYVEKEPSTLVGDNAGRAKSKTLDPSKVETRVTRVDPRTRKSTIDMIPEVVD